MELCNHFDCLFRNPFGCCVVRECTHPLYSQERDFIVIASSGHQTGKTDIDYTEVEK